MICQRFLGDEVLLSEENLYPMKVNPLFRHYVWGGQSLKKVFTEFEDDKSPLAEVWLLGEDNQIANGFLAGRKLSDVSKEFGKSLLGSEIAKKNNNQFPLLIKILDCARWLSLQVHPNDEQALELEGSGFRGKTEAWHVLEADSNASLIAGLKNNISKDEVEQRIRQGEILDIVKSHSVKKNDTVFVGAGTIHALGPGTLIYEVQQMSDLTYRVHDWDRPETEERPLHIEKSIKVIDPDIDVKILHFDPSVDTFTRPLVKCQKFILEALESSGRTEDLDTQGKGFHILTVIAGEVRLIAGKESISLKKFQSVLIPADFGRYQVSGDFRALKAQAL